MSWPWLIWSNEHNGYWMPNRAGYTDCLEQAGRYSTLEATSICRRANQHLPAHKIPDEIMVPSPETIFLVDAVFNFATATTRKS